MSARAQNITNVSASSKPEHIGEPTNWIPHHLIEEGTKANLGPLNEQISTLTRLLNQLIQESSARNSPTADTRTMQTRARRSPSTEVGISRALPATEIWSTSSPPDNVSKRIFWVENFWKNLSTSKFVRTSSGKYSAGFFKTAFYVSRGTFREEIEEKFEFIIFLGLREKNFGLRWKNFFGRIVKTAFYVFRGTF